jgi:hypothetical protein
MRSRSWPEREAARLAWSARLITGPVQERQAEPAMIIPHGAELS